MKKNILSSPKLSRQLILAMITLLFFSFFAPPVSAQTVHRGSDFNHMKTGFPLTGAHNAVECETCHTGGSFRGTPKTCAGCHSQGRSVVATFKSSRHIVTNAPCETCHTNSSSFLGVRFNHIGVKPRGCMTCHNGNSAQGKPAKHPLTNASCDVCHRTSSWLPAGYDHIGVVPGTCGNCHTKPGHSVTPYVE